MLSIRRICGTESGEALRVGKTPLRMLIWPGYARLSCHGEFSSLFEAFVFGLAIDLWMLNLLWPELLGRFLTWGLGVCVTVWWVSGVWRNRQFVTQLRQPVDPTDDQGADPLVAAQQLYLQRRWSEAEAVIRSQLDLVPRDIESGLLLCQIRRRSGQLQSALDQLGHLQNMDEALQWSVEIHREIRLIHEEMELDEIDDDTDSESNLTIETVAPETEGVSREAA